MNRFWLNVVGVAALFCVWLEPAIALAGDGGASDGFEYVQPGGITALIVYLLVKMNQVAGPLKKLADNGQLTVTTKGFEEQEAAFDAKLKAAAEATDERIRVAQEEALAGQTDMKAENDSLRAELEKLRAAQEMAAELDELRRQQAADAAKLAAVQGELDLARAKLEPYEKLLDFKIRLKDEGVDEEKDEPEPED
ncbi:MAG: hypothetical protein ACYTBJ_21975 [Planctomycetota bacterium]|jgi:hypothetical protein